MRYLLFTIILLTGCARLQSESPPPEEQIELFFETLAEEGPQVAVDDLIEGTILQAQKGAQIQVIIPQFEAVLKIYGGVRRIEAVDQKMIGESFVRHRLITFHNSDMPIFWKFTFLKSNSKWQVYTFTFNDKINGVFPEA